jgi:hypothetical protein
MDMETGRGRIEVGHNCCLLLGGKELQDSFGFIGPVLRSLRLGLESVSHHSNGGGYVIWETRFIETRFNG